MPGQGSAACSLLDLGSEASLRRTAAVAKSHSDELQLSHSTWSSDETQPCTRSRANVAGLSAALSLMYPVSCCHGNKFNLQPQSLCLGKSCSGCSAGVRVGLPCMIATNHFSAS